MNNIIKKIGQCRQIFALVIVFFLVSGFINKAHAGACFCGSGAPGTVTATAATSVTAYSFTANWNAAAAGCAGIGGYFVDVSTSSTFATSLAGYPATTTGTGTTLAVTGLPCGANTYYYRVIGYSDAPCAASMANTLGVWSNTITVTTTVCPACSGTPSAGTAQATVTSFTACTGGSTDLSLTGVTTNVTGLTYQWQSSPDNATWSNIAGATSSTSTQSVTATTYYRCKVTCSGSGLFAYSVSVLVTVPPPCSGTPAGGTAAASVTAGCANYASTISLSGNSYCNVTYQWQSSPDNSTWSNIAGATGATYAATVSANTYYRCIVTCTASGLSSASAGAYCQFGAASNDLCTSATPLGVISTTYNGNGNNLCATLSTGGITDPTPTCSARNRTLWYTFTTPAYTSSYTVSLVPGSMSFPGLAVYSGTCGAFAQVGCDYPNISKGFPEVVLSCLAANTTYYIMVYDNSAAGDFFLNIVPPTCSAGNAVATVVTKCTAGNYASTISLVGTTGCITGYQWQSSPDNATWSNVAGATAATYGATISANIYYRCVITCSNGTTSTSTSVYCSGPGAAPVNDVCASAIALTFQPGINSGDYIARIAGDNTCGTADGTTQCFTAKKSLWYKFTAPVAGSYNIMMEAGTMTYPELSIKTGTCAGLTEVSCAGVDNGTASFWESGNPPTYYPVNGYSPYSLESQYYTESGICNVTAGQTVYIMADAYSTAGTFTITVATLSNDDIPAGVLVSNCGNIFNSSTIGATNCGNCSGTPLGGGEPTTEGIMNDFDCNTGTVCNGSTGASCGSGGAASSATNASYAVNGGDVGYSVENDSWYQFCVQASTTVTVNFQPVTSTCLPSAAKGGSDGLQISIFTGSATNLTKVAGGFNGMSITTSYNTTFAMGAGQCAFVEVDGFAGTNCDYELAITMVPGCPLPVEILSFNGILQPDLITKLTWVTASEIDADHYLIEKSTDGMSTFTPVGTKAAKGNSTSMISYELYDRAPGKGVIYYKLSIVDKNGIVTFLGYTIVKNVAGLSHFNVFPNPARNSITLGLSNFSSPTVNYELYDAHGKLIRSETIQLADGGIEHTIDISGLDKGLYFIRLAGTDDILSKTFIKSE